MSTIQEDKSFQGEMVHLGPQFTDGMAITLDQIPALLQQQVLQKKTATVYKTTEKFAFDKNGFEFADYSQSPLGKAIEKLATGPIEWQDIPEATIRGHATAVEDALSDWGKTAGVQFSQVVWIDTVYRNTKAGRFGSVHFVHADFPEEDYSITLKGHSTTWKDRVALKLGDLSMDQYEKLQISQIVNIWMPLDEKIEAEPLAMMDLKSLRSKRDLRVYQDSRVNGGTPYPSIGVFPSDSQRWYIRDGMKRGEAVIFNSCKTPHSAVSLPDQGTKGRRSVECRVLFLK